MGTTEATDAGRPGAGAVDKHTIATKVPDTAVTTGEATTTPRKETIVAKVMATAGGTGATKGTTGVRTILSEATDTTQNAGMHQKNDIRMAEKAVVNSEIEENVATEAIATMKDMGPVTAGVASEAVPAEDMANSILVLIMADPKILLPVQNETQGVHPPTTGHQAHTYHLHMRLRTYPG